MKTTKQFLADLSSLGIKLWSEGGELRYKAPKGVLTPDLLSEMRNRKTELLTVLKSSPLQIDTALAPITPISRNQPLPLSFTQQRLWFLEQLEGQNSNYNVFHALSLQGNLNLTALQESLQTLIQRHETLRTSFTTFEDNPQQIIAPQLKFHLPQIDLQHLTPTETDTQIEQLAREEAQKPFDLNHPPLIRAKLLTLSPQEYVLFLSLHHIISDGWSMGILIRELSALYNAYCQGNPNPLPALPIQYADFAHWQRQYLTGVTLQTQLDYWREKLQGAPPLINLPTDYIRPKKQSYQGDSYPFSLTSELTEKLKHFSQQSGVTLYMTFLSVFAILLQRYTSQESIVIGSPIANRNRPEIEAIIGFFANTLALRIDLESNQTFLDLLSKVRQTAIEAYEYQDLPFEKLVEELQPERSLSYHPLFQVMLAFQNLGDSQWNLSDLTLSNLNINTKTAKFDLVLSVREKNKQLSLSLNYNTDIFKSDRIERMAGHLQTLVEAIIENPHLPITQLPILTKAEQQQILIDWNQTQADYPKDKCIHQLFEEQVEKTPDNIAVVFQEKKLTYQQLNEKSNQLAHYLQTLGVKSETLVGICVEPSLEMVIGLLGILKAGVAYVPFDPNYPQERLQFMLEDTQVSVLLTQEKLKAQLPPTQAQLVCLDKDWEKIAQENPDNLNTPVNADNLAYILYTSGSTGQPKGVMVSHIAVCNHLYWRQEAYPLDTKSRILAKTSLNFDPSVYEIFWPLSTGTQLCITPSQELSDTGALVELISEYQISTLSLVPSLLQVFLTEEGLEQCQSLKQVFCGGEALSIELLNQFTNKIQANLSNMYGPTESCICCTHWNSSRQTNPGIIPIGHPIANTKIYILDSLLNPVPVGVPGEIHIGGVGLARGYLNRPELTAEKFIDNPFGEGKLYKTGDLARYLPDGNIEFIGRIDHQVKIRGVRIELGEIETVLRQHPEVEQAIVTVQKDELETKSLVAYVIAKEKKKDTPERFRAFLMQKLPPVMVPNSYILLEKFPLNANGKIDLAALPKPNFKPEETQDNWVYPRNEIEQKIAQIWCECLKIEKISIHQNFFDLGGHSLLATQVISRLRQTFTDLNLPLRLLFEAPTIAELSQHIETMYWLKQELTPTPTGLQNDIDQEVGEL